MYLMHTVNDVFTIRPQGHFSCYAFQGSNNSDKFRTGGCLERSPNVTPVRTPIALPFSSTWTTDQPHLLRRLSDPMLPPDPSVKICAQRGLPKQSFLLVGKGISRLMRVSSGGGGRGCMALGQSPLHQSMGQSSPVAMAPTSPSAMYWVFFTS